MSDPLDSAVPRQPAYGEKSAEISRRDFLTEIPAAALGITALGGAIVTLRYISPNVLFEPPARFRIGVAEDYPVNSVSFLQEQQVYVVRTENGLFALSAVCTHLGCITRWAPEDNLIECPCHGSKFQRNGEKVAGPAPRPLAHFSIQIAADGQLVVDKLSMVPSSQVLKV
jgi:cytochrome b6-f complex iron-sulfur subunit